MDLTTRARMSTLLIRSNLWFIALSLLVFGASLLSAQDTILRQGAIVRFAVHANEPFRVARVDSFTSDSIILKKCGGCRGLQYSRAELDRLDIYRGTTRYAYAGIGLLLGSVVGSLAFGKYSDSHSPTCGDLCGLSALSYIWGGVIGGFGGMVIGLMAGKDKWKAVR